MNLPRVLMLTSSFPRTHDDPTASFMGEYVTALDLPGRVLVPEPRGGQVLESVGGMAVEPVRYWWGRGPRLAHGHGIPDNLTHHPTTVLQVPPYLARFATRARARAGDADVIVAHWAVPSGLVGAWVAARTGMPLVTVLHSGGVHALATLPGGRRVAAYIAHRSRAVVATSGFVGDRFLGLLPRGDRPAVHARLSVLPMGVTASAESMGTEAPGEENHAALTVLYLGRLAPVKGVDVLIDAMASLKGAHLDVVGDGPERRALERQARACGARVSFHGAQSGAAKARFLDRADAVAIPSRVLGNGRTESLPVVLLEALARGRPVVASRVGGVAAFLDGHDAARLVPPDEPEALAAALADLQHNRNVRTSMGRAARVLSKQFTWEVLSSEHRHVVTSAARGG